MMKRFLSLGATLLFGAVALASGAVADTEKGPSAVDLLFNAPHLKNLEKGNGVKYRFERKVSDELKAGKPFEDTIKVEISNQQSDGAKNVLLTIFSGDRGRDPFETPGMTGNPILTWYLNRCVASFQQLAGGSPQYLKSKFRDALGNGASVEAAKVKVNGQETDGYRITVYPYSNDPFKSRMQGFENSSFEIVVSEAVPGFFYGFTSKIESTQEEAPKVEERIEFVSAGGSE